MRLIAALLKFLGGCAHTHTRRERAADGSLLLVCDCGHVAPALTRTPEESAKAAAWLAQVQPLKTKKAKRVKAQPVATVTPMRKVK